MNDFTSEPDDLKKAMSVAIKRVIDSGWYVLGDEVKEFETQWSNTCGVKYTIGVGNGMDAIEIILRSLNIGPGDEVITTAMTAFPTVLAIYRAGAVPVIADIDYETALLSISSVKSCVNDKTKAVILVHLYGQVKNVMQWKKFCDDKGLFLIEDCAQSHLASENDMYAGSFGVAGAYSYYPTKNLGAVGDAGSIVTNDNDIAGKAMILRNYGQNKRYYHPEIGLNSRLDEIQAAILIERLRWLKKFTELRKNIASLYNEFINNKYIEKLTPPDDYDSHVYHLYVVRTKKRKQFQEYLNKNNIQNLIHYPVPIHKQLSTSGIKISPEGLGNSELHADYCISLPCHPQMTNSDANRVVDVVNSFKE